MPISSFPNPVKNDDFHCDGNEWVAINVCLIPPTALSNIAVDLSNQLCESSLYTLRTSGIESPLQPKRGFPHVTLRQLFCHKDNIEPLCIAVQSSMKMELQTQQQQTGTSSTLCNELNICLRFSRALCLTDRLLLLDQQSQRMYSYPTFA